MNKFKFAAIFICLALVLTMAGPSSNVFARPLWQTAPTLGAMGTYSVLAGTGVTNTGGTTMPGDLGVSPGSSISWFYRCSWIGQLVLRAPSAPLGMPGIAQTDTSPP